MATRGNSAKAKAKSPTPTATPTETPRKVQIQEKNEPQESLAYKVLTEEQTKELLEIEDVDILQEKLITIVNCGDHVCDLKAGSILDYFVGAVWWAKEQEFTVEQTSAFYSVVHILLENVKEKQMPLLENVKEFKKMLAGIGLSECEQNGGLECFDVTQAKKISDYIHISLFQHYLLFEFMISHTQAEEIIGTDLVIDVPKPADMPWPPPLEEGIETEILDSYLHPPKPEEDAVEGEKEKTEEELLAEQAAAEEENAKVRDILSQLTTDEVKKIMSEVFDEMLAGVKADIAHKLRDKENSFISRINKVHKVTEK